MLHFHLNVNLGGAGAGEVREFAKLGDGTILKLLATWGPFIASLFGLKLPPLPGFTSDVSEPAVETTK